MGTSDDKIVLIDLGHNVKRARKKKGYSQEELANIAEVERYQVSNLERGVADSFSTTLIKIIWALEAEPNEIIPFGGLKSLN